MKKVIIDIGTHKTGSSSRQAWLGANRARLKKHGFGFYEGLLLPDNHVELHMACMEEHRASPARLRLRCDLTREQLHREVAIRVKTELADESTHSLIFSAEGISYLKFESELRRLSLLFYGADVRIVVYLRNRADFLESYRAELIKTGLSFSDDKESFAYVSDDSWLLDYARFEKIFGAAFGVQGFQSYDYDGVVRDLGSVVPHFSRSVLGIDGPGYGAGGYWRNSRT